MKKLLFLLDMAALLPFFFITVSVTSCNQATKETVNPTANSDNCITLEGKTVKKWLNKNWHVRGDKDFVPLLCIQSYIGPGNRIKYVDVFPADSGMHLNYNKWAKATVRDDCKLPNDSMNIVTNNLKLEAGDFMDSTGKFKKIDFIRFIPFADSLNYLRYHIYFIEKDKDKENVLFDKDSWPCPDYCCPGPRCPGNEN